MSRWDPFADSFRMVERFGGRFAQGWPFDGIAAEDDEEDAALAPAADVFEDREGLTIEVELPGVLLRDVAVTVSSGAIIVEAERTFSRPNQRSVQQLEGRYGRMRRTFQLPLRAQPEKALCEMRQGILRIFVPRQAETATRTQQLTPTGDETPKAVPLG